jgi:Ca2+-binding EF-hand superfamily protein
MSVSMPLVPNSPSAGGNMMPSSMNQSNISSGASALLQAAQATGMTQEEMKSCRVFFNNFDRSKVGYIHSWELQIALEAMGYNPQMEDVKLIVDHLTAGQVGDKAGQLGMLIQKLKPGKM